MVDPNSTVMIKKTSRNPVARDRIMQQANNIYDQLTPESKVLYGPCKRKRLLFMALFSHWKNMAQSTYTNENSGMHCA